MKQGKIFWFKSDVLTPDSIPRGVIDVRARARGCRVTALQPQHPLPTAHLLNSSYTQVNKCLSIKGAEDTINKANAFEISTQTESMFFIADTDKVGVRRGGPLARSCRPAWINERALQGRD